MAEQNQDVMQGVEHHAGLWWVRGGGENHRAWNGIRYKTAFKQQKEGCSSQS